MKFIFNNLYIESKAFDSHREFSQFFEKLNVKKRELSESYGDKYFCLIGYDSLTHKQLFAISFDSDYKESDLSILIWESQKLLALYTGTHIYLLDEKMHVISFIEMSTPLIGVYITRGDNLLVLEEASARLINASGKILKSELFDLIKDFSIEDDLLSLQCVDGATKLFSLR